MQLSFKARLSFWYMAVVAMILALEILGEDWALSRAVLGQIIDGALVSLAEKEAAALVTDPGPPARIHEVPPRTAGPSFARLDKFVQIVDPDGRVLARSITLGTASLPASPAVLTGVRVGETVFETRDHFGDAPIRLVSFPVDVGGNRYAIQVAMSLDDAYAVLRSARRLNVAMSLAILAAVGLTGALMARKALRPIDRIVAMARRIGETRLVERLPHPGSEDEIGRLVETLNDMLARLEKSFEVQRRFTADASHELRSPLSRLRAELEVILRRPRDSAEYEDSLRSCLEEVERLSRLTEELLVLARLDAGEERQAPAGAIALAPILEDAVHRYVPEACGRQVEMILEASPMVSVKITPWAASLLVTNLLDNAVKFSPPGGRVTVRVTVEGRNAVVAVSDMGLGIPAEDLPLLFGRFHRGAASRANGTPGVGLGLAICRAIVERHGGEITVESGPGGATFSVRLPLAA